jgi:hypothetical protein
MADQDGCGVRAKKKPKETLAASITEFKKKHVEALLHPKLATGDW